MPPSRTDHPGPQAGAAAVPLASYARTPGGCDPIFGRPAALAASHRGRAGLLIEVSGTADLHPATPTDEERPR